jgi:tRNA (guanine10-N2)-methyltransferase
MVLDPFVGSGSILIAASHHNALCFGGDIDSRILHGKGVGRANK